MENISWAQITLLGVGTARAGVDVGFEGLTMPLAGYHASFGHEHADFAKAVRDELQSWPLAVWA